MRHFSFMLSVICILIVSSCRENVRENINGKDFETKKTITSDGVEYLLFNDPEHGVGLADAKGNVIIKGQFNQLKQIIRGEEGDRLVAVKYDEVKYSEEERRRTGYYIESRPVHMTGVYDFKGNVIIPMQFSDVKLYPNDIFLATTVPSVSGNTVDRLYKGSKFIATYDDIEVSDKGTAALGTDHDSYSGTSHYTLINPKTKKCYALGKIISHDLGDCCLVYQMWGSSYDNVMGLDGKFLLPEDTYDEIKLADGDYLICNIYSSGMEVYHASDPKTPLLQSGVYEDFIKIPGAPGLFLVREESPETRGKGWTFEWIYGVIDANGNEIIPKMYSDAEINKGFINFRYPGTWEYEDVSIEELASNYAIKK